MEQCEKPLRKGIQVFRAYVESWYSGEFRMWCSPTDKMKKFAV